MTDNEKQVKREKFFLYLSMISKKGDNNELINLTDIYEDYGHPKYLSPKRILHSRTGKQLIKFEIDKNDMQIEKVIRYQGQTVFGNYNLAIHYLQSIDAFNKYLFIDFLMKSEPEILEKYLRL
jgi:hypothetical protein